MRIRTFVSNLLALIIAISSMGPIQQALAISDQDLSSALTRSELYDPSSCGGTTPTTSGSVYILGDSIMEGAYYEGSRFLQSDLSAAQIDATVDASSGRGITTPGSDPSNSRPGAQQSGMDALDTDKSAVSGASSIVIELGTNTSGSSSNFDGLAKQLLNKVKGINSTAKIYWVNIVSTSDSVYDSYNNVIDHLPNVTVVDEKSQHISLSGDNTHPDNAGYKKYSQYLADQLSSGAPGTIQPNGGVKFTTVMTIDDDGVGPSHGDQNHQSHTSYADGQLNADTTNYIALAPGWAADHGLQLGDVAVVQHNGKSAFAVYGDNYTGDAVHGEGSVHLSLALGGTDRDTIPAPVDYTVYPGSHTLLAGSVDQSKIDQIGAQVSGSSPTAGPEGCCPSGGGGVNSLSGKDNATKAFNFFVAQGLTQAQAAGVLANLINESGVDPTSGGPTPTDGTGFGIAQWTFHARQDPLVAFAAQKNKPVTDLLVQLQFMWHELNTGYKSALDGVKAISGNDGAAASQAAIFFRDHYEVCDMSKTSCSDRGDIAPGVLQRYGGSASGGGSGGAGCAGGATVNGCSGGGPYSALVGQGASFAGIDQGIDFVPSGSKPYNICAPASGTITLADQTGHHFSRTTGEAEIIEKLDQTPGVPSSSKFIYYAEIIQIDGNIKVGVHVNKGDLIGTNDQSPGIEAGWAPNETHGFMCVIGGETPCGHSFNDWVKAASGGSQ